MVEQTTAVVLIFDINRCLGRSKGDKLHVSDPVHFQWEKQNLAIVRKSVDSDRVVFI